MLQDNKMNFTHESLQRYSDVDILSTHGRIGRKRYFVYSIVLPLILFWAISSLATFTSFLPIANTTVFYSIIGIAVLAMMYMMVRLTIQRCHDFNKSGVLALLSLIPFANIVFSLIPGTNGLNQYGEVPKPTSWLFNTTYYGLVILLIGLVIFTVHQLVNGHLMHSLFTL